MEPREIDLEAEIERLTDEMDELADELADLPFKTDAAKELQFQGQTKQRYRDGVSWATESFGPGVTLRPLTDGSRRAVRDLTEQTGYDRDQCLVAVGTVEAPYVSHDPEALSPTNDDLKTTLANIAELHPAYVDWAFDRIQDMGAMSSELGNSFNDMLLEKRRQKTKQETTGSDTAE